MDEKGTITATFEPTLDVWKLIHDKPTEWIVVNPVIVEARLRSGEVRRYPQEVRERIVRCRNCKHSETRGMKRYCTKPMGRAAYFRVCDEDFCSYGMPRNGGGM